jgi:hypothetical protein
VPRFSFISRCGDGNQAIFGTRRRLGRKMPKNVLSITFKESSFRARRWRSPFPAISHSSRSGFGSSVRGGGRRAEGGGPREEGEGGVGSWEK